MMVQFIKRRGVHKSVKHMNVAGGGQVTWPVSGRRQEFRDLAVDRAIRIREDVDTIEFLTVSAPAAD